MGMISRMLKMARESVPSTKRKRATKKRKTQRRRRGGLK